MLYVLHISKPYKKWLVLKTTLLCTLLPPPGKHQVCKTCSLAVKRALSGFWDSKISMSCPCLWYFSQQWSMRHMMDPPFVNLYPACTFLPKVVSAHSWAASIHTCMIWFLHRICYYPSKRQRSLQQHLLAGQWTFIVFCFKDIFLSYMRFSIKNTLVLFEWGFLSLKKQHGMIITGIRSTPRLHSLLPQQKTESEQVKGMGRR